MDLDIKIVYEDDDVVVINKPSGIMVHNDGRNSNKTVVDWLLTHAPDVKDVGEAGKAQDGSQLERSGVIHRLDRDTSGVLVLAKNQDVFLHLKQQFQDHLIEKEYRTFVYGNMKEKWGSIKRPIGRSTQDFRLRSAQRGARGLLREAHTDWELIGQSEEYAYLKIFPKTGRTHQIRVHMKAINRPIVCDPLYAPESLRNGDNLGFERLALHAYKLTITLPSGETKTFIAPQPEDFERAEVSLATA
jgi:23S rRNA pseudouridine1911/1915/1917 synthase